MILILKREASPRIDSNIQKIPSYIFQNQIFPAKMYDGTPDCQSVDLSEFYAHSAKDGDAGHGESEHCLVSLVQEILTADEDADTLAELVC